jgi:hypothetical protein
MSPLHDVVLPCEGVDQGNDVRLLESARQVLAAHIPVVRRISVLPAGSKASFAAVLRAERARARGAPRPVVAVRDRDFLERAVLDDLRERAVRSDAEVAWPLRRHSIESYVLDPEHLSGAAGVVAADAERLLCDLAEERRWVDAVRGALEDAAYRVRGPRPPPVCGPIGSERDAEDIARRCVGEWAAQVGKELEAERAVVKLGKLARDFERDGPPWTRVDGKELLVALEIKLRAEGKLPGGGLARRLVDHAERARPPGPLVEDLRILFAALT